jgi:transcriptional regulator GlxA family with amidase domain
MAERLHDPLVSAINNAYVIDLLRSNGEDLISPLTENPRLARLLEHVLSDLGRPISAREAAAIIGVECKHFSKVFRRETGYTFSWWDREIRIRPAKKLVRRKGLRIKMIAAAVGYDNLTTFERAFKKSSGGIAPRAYRRTAIPSSQGGARPPPRS